MENKQLTKDYSDLYKLLKAHREIRYFPEASLLTEEQFDNLMSNTGIPIVDNDDGWGLLTSPLSSSMFTKTKSKPVQVEDVVQSTEIPTPNDNSGWELLTSFLPYTIAHAKVGSVVYEQRVFEDTHMEEESTHIGVNPSKIDIVLNEDYNNNSQVFWEQNNR